MLMLKPLPIDRSAADASISVITFIAHVGFTTQELAHMVDSLVRTQRRDHGGIVAGSRADHGWITVGSRWEYEWTTV